MWIGLGSALSILIIGLISCSTRETRTVHEDGSVASRQQEPTASGGAPAVAESQPQPALRTVLFETAGAWRTAPVDLLEMKTKAGKAVEPDWLCCSKGEASETWDHRWEVKPSSYAELAGGLTLSSEHVKAGKSSGVWRDHHRFPTLATHTVAHDWSNGKGVELSIYSEVKTGEIVTLAILSDSDATLWKDYFLADFVIDWDGWKTLWFPLDTFRAHATPAGWNKVDGIYFFTKIFRRNPNPYTVLHMDSIRLLTSAPAQAASMVPSTAEANSPDTFRYTIRYEDPAHPLNHRFPESTMTTPLPAIAHQYYFRAERSEYSYFPRFTPGYPSFTPAGQAFVNAGETIQWLDDKGQWVTADIKSVLVNWGKKQGWAGLYNCWGHQGADPMVRFDKDGDAYVIQRAEALNAQGEMVSWKTRTALLLHSKDGMKTWTAYVLPKAMASFEKIDGHNPDALNRPPVILLSDFADPAGYILAPEKLTNGTLSLPKPVLYARNCIISNAHSGDGNMAITSGGTVYIVFGWLPPANAKMEYTGMGTPEAYMERVKKGEVKDLKDPANWGWTHESAEKCGMPSIPEGHPGLSMVFKCKTHWEWYGFSRNGIPTFVVAYDIAARTVSDPVYVGSGGSTLDGHNWPALTMDSKGYLHVIINGHHNPTVYTRSVNPRDISAWTVPEYVMADHSGMRGVDGQGALSYATFTCGRDDTLYSVHRGTSFRYDNSLVLYRKPSGQPWEEERTLAKPFKYMYKVWSHRMTYDPLTDRLFLTYYSDGAMAQLSWDMFQFYTFIWPDREDEMCANKNGMNSGPLDPKRNAWAMYTPGATESTTLVSADHGETWRLAVTKDFER
ncbi:MAG: hypothetical protein A3K19_09365 [Lentisphaerae bacterium RIFOXYB12_FULL_65_16]|nr:MAG: hypothetical protein A3K18_22380 [Lentisphaerae bacterium RIFOXYA12_64_32]OGV90403.1 MAG: hypothetical protein A3K19_09365 [Lentisphaerae bacterium RIFOXYB12_FULL_65_16]